MAGIESDQVCRQGPSVLVPQFYVDLTDPRENPLIKVVLDFDGTITTDDTLHLVAQAGYDARANNPRKNPTTPWEDMVVAYMADYSRHLEHYQPEKDARRTIRQEAQWLNSLAGIERASADRVYNAGVWDDVTPLDIEKAVEDNLVGDKLHLRRGVFDLLDFVTEYNPPSLQDMMLEVVSVNWSRWFIWKTLTLESQKQAKPVQTRLSNLTIYANEIPSIEDQLKRERRAEPRPGGNAVTLRTSVDKAIYTDFKYESVHETVRLIYIGDSSTDLESLLKAHVGICIRDRPMRSSQKELADVCERIKIPVEHIVNCGHIKMASRCRGYSGSPKLWWANGFEEIVDWLRYWLKS